MKKVKATFDYFNIVINLCPAEPLATKMICPFIDNLKKHKHFKDIEHSANGFLIVFTYRYDTGIINTNVKKLKAFCESCYLCAIKINKDITEEVN
ncbi:MAG: hypothetical protein PHF86_09595 [Candidatus Nanoarchaeia archaeon]|nr:hypothetical protein [Candidatus Nanoarchaeia archaeon]